MPNDRLLNLCAPVEGGIEAAAGEAGVPALRRFSMTAYTGGAMMLAGWAHPVVVDLEGLQVAGGTKSRPILKDHNRSLIVGHTDAVRIEASQLLVSGVISGAGPVAREIIESSRNGFPWQASLGAVAQPGGMEFIPRGKKAVANGREFEGPVHIARRSGRRTPSTQPPSRRTPVPTTSSRESARRPPRRPGASPTCVASVPSEAASTRRSRRRPSPKDGT